MKPKPVKQRKAVLDTLFAFGIGDTLRHVAMPAKRWHVVGRVVEECSTAAQLFYTCRGVNADGRIAQTRTRFAECELRTNKKAPAKGKRRTRKAKT